MATKYVQDTAAGKSISAWAILDKKRNVVAKVQAHHVACGNVLVNVRATGEDFQHARGNDVTGALRGMKIDGHTLGDHCGREGAPALKKGHFVWPKDTKVKPGYHFANYATVDAKTGHKIYISDFMETEEYRGFTIADGDKKYQNGEWIKRVRFEEMKIASGDWAQGYADCYKRAGLDYLSELGYTVIQAI